MTDAKNSPHKKISYDKVKIIPAGKSNALDSHITSKMDNDTSFKVDYRTNAGEMGDDIPLGNSLSRNLNPFEAQGDYSFDARIPAGAKITRKP